MEKIPVHQLVPSDMMRKTLLHETGHVLHEAGLPLGQEHIDCMKELGIRLVVQLDCRDNIVQNIRNLRTRMVMVDEVKSEDELAAPIINPKGGAKGEIVLAPRTTPPRLVRSYLKNLGVQWILVKRRFPPVSLDRWALYRQALKVWRVPQTEAEAVEAIARSRDVVVTEAAASTGATEAAAAVA